MVSGGGEGESVWEAECSRYLKCVNPSFTDFVQTKIRTGIFFFLTTLFYNIIISLKYIIYNPMSFLNLLQNPFFFFFFFSSSPPLLVPLAPPPPLLPDIPG